MASVTHARTARVTGRTQLGLLVLLLVAAAIAWVLTRERMLGMDAGPGTDLGGLGFYVVSWVVMMAAMMFPSIAPMVLTFAFIQGRRRERGALERAVSHWTLIAGYLLAWTTAGLGAYGLFVAVRSLSIPALSWHRDGPYLAGAVLIAAAVYQLTPAKNACLSRCRGPLDFLMTQWREGPRGALRMGLVHGAWCLGCCWGLMASLFALGVMSLTWMIVVAALIAVEKLLPSKALANRLVASALLLLGLGVAFAPHDVPGLTIPGSPAAARAMHSMGMHGAGMGTMDMRAKGTSPHGAAMPQHSPGTAQHSMGTSRHGAATPQHSPGTARQGRGIPRAHTQRGHGKGVSGMSGMSGMSGAHH